MSFQQPLPHAVCHAQELRKRSTPAEAELWHAVRNRKFHGLKFRRQAPIGRFIVDFLCTNPPFIIELDGPIHDFSLQEDAERTDVIMKDHNIPILRFKNEEILNDLPKALRTMEEVFLPRLPTSTAPHPLAPSPAAAGEKGEPKVL